MKRFVLPAAVLLGTVALIPFALIARGRVSTSDQPRLHVIFDMDQQARFETQRATPLFADERTMRAPVPGTVARGEARLDDHLERGQVDRNGELVWAERFPSRVKVDAALLQRGRERYEIHCSMCHGYSGGGDGMVDKRVKTLVKRDRDGVGGWTTPTNLRSEQIRGQPVGEIYNTIANGKNTMPAYGAQVDVRDRWAIVAYVRALQRTQTK